MNMSDQQAKKIAAETRVIHYMQIHDIDGVNMRCPACNQGDLEAKVLARNGKQVTCSQGKCSTVGCLDWSA